MGISIVEFLQHLKYASYEFRYLHDELLEKQNNKIEEYSEKEVDLTEEEKVKLDKLEKACEMCFIYSVVIKEQIENELLKELSTEIESEITKEMDIYELKELLKNRLSEKSYRCLKACLEFIDRKKEDMLKNDEERLKKDKKDFFESKKIEGDEITEIEHMDELMCNFFGFRSKDNETLEGLDRYIDKIRDRGIEEVIKMNDEFMSIFEVERQSK